MRKRLKGTLIGMGACLIILACDVPLVEQRWKITLFDDEIGMGQLVGETVNTAGTDFEYGPVEFDDLADTAFVDRLRGDITVEVTLTNTLPISLVGTISFGDAVNLTADEASVSIQAGTVDAPVDSVNAVTVTRDELRALATRGEFSMAGRVTTDGEVTFTEADTIGVKVTVASGLVTES